MNHKQLAQVFSDKETEHMNKYSSEELITLQAQNQRDMEEAINREENSLETHFHSARQFPDFEIVKVLDADGEWNQLWSIKDKGGKELPKELSGSWSDVTTAVNTLRAFERNKKEI